MIEFDSIKRRMTKIIITSILCLLLLSGCGLVGFIKVQDAYEAETMSKQFFKEELFFQEVNGLIVIQAEFEGVVKNFVFDTGATTILDKHFASTLEVQKLGKVKTFDTNRKKKHIPYVKIKEFSIGEISFYDMVASVSDLQHLNTAACIDVSGVIGANAMNKCVWQIDYQKKKITFTNHRDSLELSGQEKKINFSAMGKGVPTISLYSNGDYWGEAIFDTGSNGSITINEKYLTNSFDFIEEQTYTFAVFTAKIKNKKLATVPSIHLNNAFSLNNQLVTFEENMPFGIIGNKFMRDYIVTIDWKYQQILLGQYETIDSVLHKDFGFSPHYINDTVVIGSIRLNSRAYQQGLRLNDRIVAINGIAFDDNAYVNYCKYLEERNSWESVTLIVHKENEELEVHIEKRDLMELLEEKE